MFAILAFVLVVVLILDYAIVRSGAWKVYNKVPGIKRIPFFGNVFEVFRDPTPLFYKARQIANEYRNRSNICGASLFYAKVLNVYDPSDLEVLLSSPRHIRKGKSYMFLLSWLKDGLLTSDGEKWQTRRKILTPTFHFNILRQFCKMFAEQSDILVKKLKSEVGKEIEIVPYVTEFALRSILETAMGINADSKKGALDKYMASIYDMGQVILTRFARPWMYPNFLFNMSATSRKEKVVLRYLHDFTTNVIRERRATTPKQEKINVEDMDDDKVTSAKKRLAMMDLLLQAEVEGKINESGIREEVDTFTFEGHDTTTQAITFSLMLLANHPEVQERIHVELKEVLGETDRVPTIEDYNKMNYLEMCIKESLRLYPSVPFISRYLTEDLHLKKFTIPAYTDVFIHIFDVHRNPDLYPDPDRYDPERFSPENSRGRHPFAYIPFSAGPRNCIGQRFALLEEKAVISAILRNYWLEAVTTPDDVVFACDMVLRSTVPIKVKFLHRQKN